MKKHSAFSLIELSIAILIVGIIIAGVMQSSSLIRKMKLSSVRQMTASSPVVGIRDVVLWIDSTSEQSFDTAEQADGSTISSWYDINPQSPIKNNFTQSTSANKPTYKQTFFNGLPSVYFDGSTDYMQTSTTSLSTNYFNNADFTVFVAAYFPTTTQSTSVLFQLVQSGGSRNLGFEFNSTNLLRMDSANASSTGSTALTFDQGVIISGYRDQSNAILYVNGAQYASATSGSSDILSGKFAIGAYVDSLDHFTKAYIGEIIVYGHALTTEERKAVETYLGKKWGVKVS
jgi:prepilin-type N-terminal cleavage/methylation domain-containing protein